MFEVGDRVFYGVVGVCEVEDIAAPPIKGIDGKYYYFNMGAVMAALILAVIPVVIFYLACQKHIIKGVAAGAVKG